MIALEYNKNKSIIILWNLELCALYRRKTTLETSKLIWISFQQGVYSTTVNFLFPIVRIQHPIVVIYNINMCFYSIFTDCSLTYISVKLNWKTYHRSVHGGQLWHVTETRPWMMRRRWLSYYNRKKLLIWIQKCSRGFVCH